MRLPLDLAFAVRSARRRPGFTLVLLAALALGIGLTTAIFSVFYGVLLKPLAFREPDRLALVMEKLPRIPTPINMPPASALELSANPAFSQAAIFRSSSRNLESGDRPERVECLRASAGLLPLLGITPARGRAFTRGEDEGGARVAMISENFARSRFGDANALGKKLDLDGVEYRIAGILPAGFVFPMAGMSQAGGNADVWIPLSLTAAERSPQNSDFSYSLIARLRPGVTAAQAQLAAHAAIERILSAFPPAARGRVKLEAAVLPLKEQVVGNSRRLLWLLLGAVAALLLVSCLNVSNMLLSRALERRRELSVRAALGASAKRIAIQLLNETLLLFLCGGALGALSAVWLERALIRLLPANLPRLEEIHVDARVLAFAVAASLATGLLFGLAPALATLRRDLAAGLHESSRSLTRSRGVGTIRRSLVTAQIALAFVLLTAAGLLIRSFFVVLDHQAALRTDKVLTFGIALPARQYLSAAAATEFYRELARRFDRMPGVLSTTFGTDIPLENKSGRLITAEHMSGAASPVVFNTDIEGAYFQTMGLPIVTGRALNERDRADSELVAVVNRAFGKAFWPGESPINRRFKFGSAGTPAPWVRIVGVAADSAARAPDSPAAPRIYIPFDQERYAAAKREAWFAIRTQGDSLSIAHSVEAAVHSLDPQLPVMKLRSMDQVVSAAVAPRAANTWLIGVFALAALLLSSLGVYGVVAHSVAERTREIGMRMALGACGSDIFASVLREGGRLTVLGLAIGALISFALSRVIQALLFGVTPQDPVTRGVVIVAIALTVFAAVLAPSWRAMRVDPCVALRDE